MGAVGVQLQIEYGWGADQWFWLRQPAEGNRAADMVRARLAEALSSLPSSSSPLVDVTVAALRSGAAGGDLAAFADRLPAEVAGVALRDILRLVVDCLGDAPKVPLDRQESVETRLAELDIAGLEHACDWVADRLGFAFSRALTFKVIAVADGVPLSGVTGHLNGKPWSFVSVIPHPGSTLAEMVVHEATHAMDLVRSRDQPTLIDELREMQPASSQAWHVPFFVLAAKAIRLHVDPDHVDYGDTHGYYAKVRPREFALAVERLRL